MTTILDTVTEYETKALELLTQAQAEVLTYVKQIVDFIDGRLPELELPEIELLAQLPTLNDIVVTQFAFSKKVLASQEKFAKNVVKAIQPLTLEGLGAKPAAAAAA